MLGSSRTRPPPANVTSDPRWSQLQTHRVSVDLSHTWQPAPDSFALRSALSLGVYHVAYADSDFRAETGLEASLWLSLVI